MRWQQGVQRRARKAWRKAHKDQGPMLAGESPRPSKTLALRDLLRNSAAAYISQTHSSDPTQAPT